MNVSLHAAGLIKQLKPPTSACGPAVQWICKNTYRHCTQAYTEKCDFFCWSLMRKMTSLDILAVVYSDKATNKTCQLFLPSKKLSRVFQWFVFGCRVHSPWLQSVFPAWPTVPTWPAANSTLTCCAQDFFVLH